MGEKLRVRRSRRIRQGTLLLGCCLALYCLFFVSRTPTHAGRAAVTEKPWTLSPDLLRNLSLDAEQCDAAFPGLTKEIDDAVAQGPFALKQTGDSGPLQGRIKDGQLYIIHAQRRADLSTEMVNSRTAALHQFHRALITSPTPLPDTIFSLNFQDSPFGTSWAYSRPADRSQSSPGSRNFLMPHFSFWSWPLPFIGSVSRAATAITTIESSLPFSKKIPKAVWRGTTWFNSVHNPRLRQNLLKAAREKTWDWADVEALRWEAGNASNAIRIEDFCRYRYVVHTEGVAYSGRFQFLQMCGSVTVTTPIVWMQHTTHLVRPVFSGTLLKAGGGNGSKGRQGAKEKAGTARGGAAAVVGAHDGRKSGAGTAGDGKGGGKKIWMPSERVRKSWPREFAPEEANIVFVAPDWSDLEDTIGWLEDHPHVAEGIARRQREMFVGGGYFSPAAEVCYWRALVRGWAEVVRTEGQGWEGLEGVPFETFALSNGD